MRYNTFSIHKCLKGIEYKWLLFFDKFLKGIEYKWGSLLDIFIEQTNRTWKNASRLCTLYGSDKAPSDVDSVQNIPRPVSMDGSLHWVGATATFTPWFKFVGNSRNVHY